MHPGTNFLTKKSKEKLTRIIQRATKITGTTQAQLSDLYIHTVKREADSISKDPIRQMACVFI